MDYCKRLKKLRIENGYTHGKRELPIKHLIALCCLYRVSADYVLGIEKFVKSE